MNSTRAACFGRAHEDQLAIAQVLVLVGISLFFTETPSYEQIFTPLSYAEMHPVELPPELEGLGTKGLHERLAVNGTLRVKQPSFTDSVPGPVEILDL